MAEEKKSANPSTHEIAARGEAIYKEKWEKKLTETAAGKFVAVNINTGDAQIGDTSEEALRLAEQKDSKGFFHLIRVGRKSAFEAGWYMSHAR